MSTLAMNYKCKYSKHHIFETITSYVETSEWYLDQNQKSIFYLIN